MDKVRSGEMVSGVYDESGGAHDKREWRHGVKSDGERVALVTGAGQGIGTMIARKLAAEGYRVGVHFFHGEETARALVAESQASGHDAVAIYGDLTQPEVPQQVVAKAVAALGRIDVVVNNAGVTFSTPFRELSVAEVDRCYRINFLAPLWVTRAAVDWMVAHGQMGSIVQITSVHQERVTDRDNIYGAMKAALARLTESLAYELAPQQIRVNCVAPGRIDTPEQATRRNRSPERQRQIAAAIPIRRAGSSEEVAEVVRWLASDESRYVTGITVRIDGGLNLAMFQAVIDGVPHFI